MKRHCLFCHKGASAHVISSIFLNERVKTFRWSEWRIKPRHVCGVCEAHGALFQSFPVTRGKKAGGQTSKSNAVYPLSQYPGWGGGAKITVCYSCDSDGINATFSKEYFCRFCKCCPDRNWCICPNENWWCMVLFFLSWKPTMLSCYLSIVSKRASVSFQYRQTFSCIVLSCIYFMHDTWLVDCIGCNSCEHWVWYNRISVI